MESDVVNCIKHTNTVTYCSHSYCTFEMLHNVSLHTVICMCVHVSAKYNYFKNIAFFFSQPYALQQYLITPGKNEFELSLNCQSLEFKIHACTLVQVHIYLHVHVHVCL